MPDYLFTYGTLLPGAAPAEIAGVAARLKAIGEGQVRGRLYDLGHFPGAVLEADQYSTQHGAQHFIHGTVFELPDDIGISRAVEISQAAEILRATEILRALDAYEEFDPADAAASQFLRTRCVVSLPSGTAVECWIYVYNRGVTGAPLVEGGRWNAGAGMAVRSAPENRVGAGVQQPEVQDAEAMNQRDVSCDAHWAETTLEHAPCHQAFERKLREEHEGRQHMHE